MRIILLEKIRKLGEPGEVVNVKPGYARNFLFVNNKAEPATEKNLAAVAKIKAEIEAKEAQKKKAAEEKQKAMADLKIEIKAKTSDEDGKLFGAIGTAEIVKALGEQNFEIERSAIILPEEAMKNTGEYEIRIQLHADVTLVLPVSIIAETDQSSD